MDLCVRVFFHCCSVRGGKASFSAAGLAEDLAVVLGTAFGAPAAGRGRSPGA